MTSPEGAGAARRGGRRAGLLATACLVALAPVKFSLPAVLHHLDTWPRGIGEWLFMSWPSAIFLGLLVLCLGLAAWEVRGVGVPLRPLAPAAGFFLAQGFSALFTVDRPLSGAVMALFASLVAGYALGLALVREERDLRWVLAGWVAGACAVAWSGVGQATGGAGRDAEVPRGAPRDGGRGSRALGPGEPRTGLCDLCLSQRPGRLRGHHGFPRGGVGGRRAWARDSSLRSE